MVGYISKTVDVAPEKIKFTTTPSGKGTYTSVTIEAPVASADATVQLTSVGRSAAKLPAGAPSRNRASDSSTRPRPVRVAASHQSASEKARRAIVGQRVPA